MFDSWGIKQNLNNCLFYLNKIINKMRIRSDKFNYIYVNQGVFDCVIPKNIGKSRLYSTSNNIPTSITNKESLLK